MLFLVINYFLKKQDQNNFSPEDYFVTVFPSHAAQDMCSPKREVLDLNLNFYTAWQLKFHECIDGF